MVGGIWCHSSHVRALAPATFRFLFLRPQARVGFPEFLRSDVSGNSDWWHSRQAERAISRHTCQLDTQTKGNHLTLASAWTRPETLTRKASSRLWPANEVAGDGDGSPTVEISSSQVAGEGRNIQSVCAFVRAQHCERYWLYFLDWEDNWFECRKPNSRRIANREQPINYC
jgi:hypothetical protein